MAIKVSVTMGDGIYQTVKSAAISEGFDTPESYLLNLAMMSATGTAKQEESEETIITFDDLKYVLQTEAFHPENLTALFLIIAQKMSKKEREFAALLLKNFDKVPEKIANEMRENIKGQMIHTPPAPYIDKPKREQPDINGVSNQIAEDVIESQLAKSQVQEKTAKVVTMQVEGGQAKMDSEGMPEPTPKESEFTKDNKINAYDYGLEGEDDYDYGDEEDEEGEDLIVDVPKTEPESIIKLAQANEIKEVEKRHKEADKVIDERARQVARDENPDDDTPDWGDDDFDINKISVKDDESAKVVEEQKGLSQPVEPKKPKVLAYDPKDVNKQVQVPLGPYANSTNRVKSTRLEISKQHNTKFLQNLG